MENKTLELEALVMFGKDNICVMDEHGNIYSVIHPKDYDVNNYKDMNNKIYYKIVSNKEERELVLDVIYAKGENEIQ